MASPNPSKQEPSARREETLFDYNAITPGYYDRIFRTGFVVRRFWHHLKFQSVMSALPKAAKTILDIGCGPGSMLSVIDNRHLSIGIDISHSQVLYARENYGTPHRKFVCSASNSIPFKDQSFDAVTMVEVIEHLPLPVVNKTLSEIKRILKPEGLFIMTTPNYMSIWPILERLIAWFGAPDYNEQHLMRFTPYRLKKFLESHGFGISNLDTFFIIAPFVSLISWKLGDAIYRLERIISNRFGSLILAKTTVRH